MYSEFKGKRNFSISVKKDGGMFGYVKYSPYLCIIINHLNFKSMLVKNDVRCNWCDWEGYEDDLDLIVDLSDDGISHDVHYLKVCPGCKQEDYLMDIDNDNSA